jgi:lipopolysaccharide transport system ATP-binding protein
MSFAVKTENLGKKYIIYHQTRERYLTLRDTIANGAKNAVKSFLGRFNEKYKNTKPKKEEFWALRDITFEVKDGERIGIIGRNGAGKSTLLKLLSRITEPSTGRFSIKGRIASLLEVGTGFHAELTGRENIFLNGSVLGMTRSEIKKKFDEIVAFSEVEKFLDTPVKRYSSGMYVRLAFSIAAHLEPDILIVDEVLAVGDAEFQKKCLGKMEDASKKEGRTVLFVSHNMNAITSLCTKALYLSNGRFILYDTVQTAISEYLNKDTTLVYEKNNRQVIKNPFINKAYFVDERNGITNQFINGSKINLVMEIQNDNLQLIEIAISFWDNMRRPLWNFTHAMQGLPHLPKNKKIKTKISFKPPQLSVTDIIVDFAIVQPGSNSYFDHVISGLKYSLINDVKSKFLQVYPNWPILCDAIIENEIIEK